MAILVSSYFLLSRHIKYMVVDEKVLFNFKQFFYSLNFIFQPYLKKIKIYDTLNINWSTC